MNALQQRLLMIFCLTKNELKSITPFFSILLFVLCSLGFWKPGFAIDHTQVSVVCIDCHNGVSATGKNDITHPSTTDHCSACHSTLRWIVTTVDHVEARALCEHCHKTTTPLNHLIVSLDRSCDSCHNTTAWNSFQFRSTLPSQHISPLIAETDCARCHNGTSLARFDHSLDTPGTANGCINCHNGAKIAGKNPDHPLTSDACDRCHSNSGLSWASNISVDHNETLGSCDTCHEQNTAGFSTGFAAGECNSCHDSTTWTSVFSGSNPHTYQTAVGASTGSFSVGASGSAKYTYPIVVPPGINGMQPILALNYSSGREEGALGVGWSLVGLSQVSRCRATMMHDGFVDAVDFDDKDRFCLDDQRLIEVTKTVDDSACSGFDGSTATALAEYSTEIRDYTRIVACGLWFGQSGQLF